MSKVLSPQTVVLLWIFGPLLTLSLARAACQWRGAPCSMDWPRFLARHSLPILRKMPLVLALAVVGFWA